MNIRPTKLIKSSVIKVINYLGYTVYKLPPKPQKKFKVVEIVVAGKIIKVHSGNPLRYVYQENPSCNTLMARATTLVKEKYPTAWAIDAGANVGDTLAIIRSKTNLPIICVEGDPHCYKLLEENARLFDNVYTFNVFLSNQSGLTFVKTDKEGWNTTLLNAQDQKTGRMVKFETLDSLTSNLKCQNAVKFIKVDAEGYDMRILKGAADILISAKPVITFELNRENIAPLGDSVPDFFEYLTKMGFNNFFMAEGSGKPVCALRAGDQHLFSSLYQYSGLGRAICYFDVWAFHQDDQDLFVKFLTNVDGLEEKHCSD